MDKSSKEVKELFDSQMSAMPAPIPVKLTLLQEEIEIPPYVY